MATIVQSAFRPIGASTPITSTPIGIPAYDFVQEKEHWKLAPCLEFCAPGQNWTNLHLQISNRLYIIKSLSAQAVRIHNFHVVKTIDALKEAIKDLRNLSEDIIDDLLNLSEHPLVQSARLSGAEAIAETKEGMGTILIAFAKTGSADENPFDNPLLLIRLTTG